MKVGIQTFGSAGDVRPLIALAGALRSAGHEVIIAISSVDGADYAPLCRALDITLLPVESLDTALTPLDRLSEPLGRSRNPFRQIRMLLEQTFFPQVEEIYAASRQLCARSECVIGHFLVYPLAVAARRSGTPHGAVIITPGMVPSAFHPPPGSLDLPNLGPRANRLIWRLVEWAIDRELRTRIAELWQREGLTPPRHVLSGAWQSETINLIAASPLFVNAEPDWAGRIEVCGAFRVPERAEPSSLPAGLDAFLAEGSSPVFMTLGSVRLRSAADEAVLLAETAARAGCRAVIQTRSPAHAGRSGDGRTFFVPSVVLRKLLPRCSAALHHGGSQTVLDVVRAGLPSVVVPYIEEQVIWAKTLHRQGLAPRPIGWRRATPRRLASALREALTSSTLAANAQRIGKQLQAEDGAGRAVRLIEASLGGRT